MSSKRPNQNSNGSPKGRSSNPNGQAAPPPPGVRPSTAPHSALKSNLLAAAQAQAAQAEPGQPGTPAPAGAPHPPLPPMTAGGTGGDLGMLQTRVNFKDLPGPAQAQTEQQMGIDPYAMLKVGGQAATAAAQQGQAGDPQQGYVPNSLSGPGIDPSAQLDNFPHDLGALVGLMHQGYSPGASAGELAQAQNAHSIARAMDVASQQQAQNATAHGDAMQQLTALLQKLHLAGQLPHPDDVAQNVMAQQGPPQLGSAMAPQQA